MKDTEEVYLNCVHAYHIILIEGYGKMRETYNRLQLS